MGNNNIKKSVRQSSIRLGILLALVSLQRSIAWQLPSNVRIVSNRTPNEGPTRAFHLAASKVVQDIGSANIPGSDPDRPQKVNQDAHFHCSIESGGKELMVAGVMDGHGLKGHVVTQYLQKRLQERIRDIYLNGLSNNDYEAYTTMLDNICKLGNVKPEFFIQEEGFSKTLMDSFHLAHLDARLDPDVPAGRSGSTCVVCGIEENGKMTVANVGDSRGVLVTHCDTGTVVTPLTNETTTQIPGELDRIQKCEGRVDARGNVFYGPQGIAMTRSLGNAVMLRAGVVPTPVISQVDLTPKCNSWVVLGTDGVWDVVPDEILVDIIQQNVQTNNACSAQSIADAITNEAKQKWLGDLPVEVKVDDISCIVIQCLLKR